MNVRHGLRKCGAGLPIAAWGPPARRPAQAPGKLVIAVAGGPGLQKARRMTHAPGNWNGPGLGRGAAALTEAPGARRGPRKVEPLAESRYILREFANKGLFQKAPVKSASGVCQKRLSYESVYIHKRSTDNCQSTFSEAL